MNTDDHEEYERNRQDLLFRPNNVHYLKKAREASQTRIDAIPSPTEEGGATNPGDGEPEPAQEKEDLEPVNTPDASRTLCNPDAAPTPNTQPKTKKGRRSPQARMTRTDDGPRTNAKEKQHEKTTPHSVYHIHRVQDERNRTEINEWASSQWNPTPTLAFARVGNEQRPHRVVIDTGADLSLVSAQYLQERLPGYHIDNSHILSIRGVNGVSRTLGSVVLDLTFTKRKDDQKADTFHIRFHVTDDMPNGLLVGNNALIPMNALINVGTGQMLLNNQEYMISSAKRRGLDVLNGGHSRDVRLRTAFRVEAGKRAVVPASVITGGFATDFMIEPVQMNNGARLLRGARVLCTAGQDEIAYEVFNATRRPIHLKKGTRIGIAHPVPTSRIRPVTDIQDIIDQMEEESAQFKFANFIQLDEVKISKEDKEEYTKLLDTLKINDSLTAQQRERVERLLWAKRAAFASERNPIGCTKDAVFDVNTGDTPPVTAAPYHASPLRRRLINERVQALKEAKLAVESNSEWSSPVIMVEQHGQYRMCIDYRALNRNTIGDQYPVPRVFDVLESLEGCHYFSSFDCNRGYYQIPTTPAAAKKLAFRTQEGLYEPRRMPFGAKGAPATFQRLMDKLLAEGRWLWCLAYLDDIIIYSRTFDEHLQHVDWVLGQMIKSGITLHPAKSHLFVNDIELLGHHVSKAGIAKGRKALEALEKQQKPMTVKQLSRFIGLASHYRRFVKNFARIAAPLRELMRRATEQRASSLPWDPTFDAAYETLMKKMTEDVVLAHPNYGRPFYIESDASLDGLGAVLSQKDEKTGQLRPIAFVSRQTVDGEKNMAATELECAGVMWALEKFRPYIEGGKVELLCDHKALQVLKNYSGPCKRMQRASATLMAYNSDTQFTYRPSAKMAHVDALSRNPLPASQEDREHPEEEIREPLEHLRASTEAHSASMVWNVDDTGALHEVNMLWVVEPDTEIINEIDKHMYEDKHYTDIIDQILLRYDISCEEKPYKKDEWRSPMFHPSRPFIINNGVLYTTLQHRHAHAVYVPDIDAIKRRIFHLYHDIPISGHRGGERTYLTISRDYFWKGITKDVKYYVRTCDACQHNKPENALPVGLLKPIENSKERWGMIQMDWTTGLPTSNGYDACLVVLDRLTKRARFIPTTDKIDAAGVASLLFDHIFSQFGLPRVIISDRDSKLTSDVWTALMEYMGVQHRLSTAHHQQTDGGSERTIRILKEALRHYVDKDGSNWSRYLSRLEVAYNSTPQGSTGQTPFELDMGRVPFFAHSGGAPDLAREPMRLARKMEMDAEEDCSPSRTPSALRRNSTIRVTATFPMPSAMRYFCRQQCTNRRRTARSTPIGNSVQPSGDRSQSSIYHRRTLSSCSSHRICGSTLE